MSGHTPGPWKVGGQSGNPGEGLEIAAKERLIAWGTATYNEGEDEDVVTDEDRANARLIANAPDLLAALKVAADAIDYVQAQVDSENDRHNLLVRLVQVKRVIAKAEGGDA